MPTIQPVNPNESGPAAGILGALKAKIGMVPNIFATMAHSPALLQAYLGYSDGLGQGVLRASLREQIALAVAGENECDYCASAHTAMGRSVGITAAETALNLRGEASNNRTSAILAFVRNVVRNRGHVDASALDALRAHSISDAELVEIMVHIGVNLFTNYFNHVVGTDIDFPLVSASEHKRAA